MSRIVVVCLFGFVGCVRQFDKLPTDAPPAAPVTPDIDAPERATVDSTIVVKVTSPLEGLSYDWQVLNGTLASSSRASEVTIRTGGIAGPMFLTVNVSNSRGVTTTPAQAVIALIEGVPEGYTPQLIAPQRLTTGRSGLAARIGNVIGGVDYTWSIDNGTLVGLATSSHVTFDTLAAGELQLTARSFLAGVEQGVSSVATIPVDGAAGELDIFSGTAGGAGFFSGTADVAVIPNKRTLLTSDPAGNLYMYAEDLKRLIQISATGTVSSLAEIPDVISAITFGQTNDVLLAVEGYCGVILSVSISDGAVSTWAGDREACITDVSGGTRATLSLSSVTALATTSANEIYVAAELGSFLLKIDGAGAVISFASGGNGFCDDGEFAALDPMDRPSLDRVREIFVAPGDSVWVADQSHTTSLVDLRHVTSTGIYTPGGCGTAAGVVADRHVFDADGHLYAYDGKRVNKHVDAAAATSSFPAPTLLSGAVDAVGFADGPGESARFNSALLDPGESNENRGDLVKSGGELRLSDPGNGLVRAVTLAGVTRTLVGKRQHTGDTNGHRSEALYFRPQALAVDERDNVFVVDEGNNRVRRIAGDLVSNVTSGREGVRIGPPQVAAHERIHSIVARSDGKLVATVGNLVRLIGADGSIEAFAGDGGPQCDQDPRDGSGPNARFCSGTILAMTGDTIYAADSSVDVVRSVDMAGNVFTLAGNGESGFSDDPSLDCFSLLTGIAAKGGSTEAIIYVADNGVFRRLSFSPFELSLAHISGEVGSVTLIDGACATARHHAPHDLQLDRRGDLWFIDGSFVRRIVSPDTPELCRVETVIGKSGIKRVSTSAFSLNTPAGLAFTTGGDLLVSDAGENVILRYRVP